MCPDTPFTLDVITSALGRLKIRHRRLLSCIHDRECVLRRTVLVPVILAFEMVLFTAVLSVISYFRFDDPTIVRTIHDELLYIYTAVIYILHLVKR